MDNEEIQKERQQYAGFVLYANPSYTSRKHLAIEINTALKQTAASTEALSIQYAKTDGNLVSCHAGAIRGQAGVHSDGVIMRTSNANAKLTATLLAKQDDEVLGPYYKLIPKGMDTTLGPAYHDKLLINNNVEINDQRAITITNIPYDGFFTVKFNPTPDIQGSTKITINSYLIHQCNIVSIERTNDVEATGKYFLIVRNNDFIQAKTKFASVLHKFRQAAPTIAMQDSYSKFHAYPEIVDGTRRDPTLTNKGDQMKLFLDQSPNRLTQIRPQSTPQQYKFFNTPTSNTATTTNPPRTSYASVTRPQQQSNPPSTLANNPPTTQQSTLIDTHMHDTDEQTTHTNMSGTSFDQTVKTMQSALTEIETLVESIQTQQRTSDAARQQADLARDEDLIRRETARDKLRMAEETKRRLDDEQRYQQTTRERQKDSDEHQAKLLEVEAKTTKLFEENMAQQQRTQENTTLI